MKVIGAIIKQMEKVDLNILMVIFMKESGCKTKHVAMGFTIMPMVLSMKDFGRITYSMAKAKSSGQIKITMWVNISKGRNKARENMIGMMVVFTKVNGLTIKLMDLADIYGQMVEGMKVR
jgi:hypothetical protein